MQSGDAKEAEQQMGTLLAAQGAPNQALCVASLHCAMGHIDEALEWLEKSLRAREHYILDIPLLPDFDSIRADPRFGLILSRLGLSS